MFTKPGDYMSSCLFSMNENIHIEEPIEDAYKLIFCLHNKNKNSSMRCIWMYRIKQYTMRILMLDPPGYQVFLWHTIWDGLYRVATDLENLENLELSGNLPLPKRVRKMSGNLTTKWNVREKSVNFDFLGRQDKQGTTCFFYKHEVYLMRLRLPKI